MNDLRIVQASSPDVIITSPVGGATIDDVWFRLFDVARAVRYVDTVIADKGSDRNPEQHTRKAYESSLRYFLNWLGPRLPDKDVRQLSVYELVSRYQVYLFPGPEALRAFIAHLKGREGEDGKLAKSTVDRYLAPIRHFLTGLRKQHIAVTGEVREFVRDCKEFIEQALDEKAGGTEEDSGGMPAVYAHGMRLKLPQLDSLLAAMVEDDSLRGRRDMALLYVGFTTGLRDAELRRMALANIHPGEHGSRWEVRVRGKRNNYQPVPLDHTAYQLIQRWVEAYNGGLEGDDARRIVGDVPIFQPLLKGGHYGVIGSNGFSPCRGMGNSGVREIVKDRSMKLLGVELSSHDMRRTVASIGRQNGMDFEQLQFVLRHKSIATTQRYVGNPPDLGKSQLSNYVNWSWNLS